MFQNIDILSVPLFLSNIDKKSGKERTTKNIDKKSRPLKISIKRADQKSGPIKISIKRADQKSGPLFLALLSIF